MYTYIFVEPKTGASDFLILPSVSIEWMEKALEEFVRMLSGDYLKAHQSLPVLKLNTPKLIGEQGDPGIA